MKEKFVNAIKPGDVVSDIFVLYEKALSQKKNGDNYLNITLSDKTGRVRCVIWDNAENIFSSVNIGDFVYIEGNAAEYQGKLQIVVSKIQTYSADSIDPADFIPATCRNIDTMFDRLLKITNTIRNRHLRNLLKAFWEDTDFVNKFKTAPAAKKMHHSYIGGLLEHSLSMALLVERIASHYSGIDIDLLLTGAILHDIGKVRELKYNTHINYSDEGRFLSHIVIGYGMVEEKIRTIEGFPENLAVLIKHMIISHHGSREFGSPEPPKTIEAVLLNYIDEIDAKVNGIRQYIAADDSTEQWTGFHKLLGRHFYKGKKS